MHTFPQLRKLERRFPNEVAVIGVHAAKFPSEKETATIRWAMLRHDIEHPVVNDRDFRIWQSYAVRAWPTLVFIDPIGKVIGAHAGELPYEALEQLIGEMITEFDAIGLLDHQPFVAQRLEQVGGVLAFPTKLLVNGDRLIIADTGHHRVVIADREGTIHTSIGGGPGAADGDFASARFDRPRGIALDGETLYIADTENHTIRLADLRAGTVTAVAGTGEQGHGLPAGGRALETEIRSPWDLVVREGVVYIAMAGSHQIWAYDPETGYLYPYAGAGPEALQDGPLRTAYLAQPSGITTDGVTGLIFADSETSAIRWADFHPDGDVITYVGQDLFVFGDVDGIGEEVRLQHPIGVHYANDTIFIADSFNHKIKRLGPRTRACVTMAGSGVAGNRDGSPVDAQFNEPEGLWAADGTLYVADTNSHAIRLVDIASGSVRTLAMTEAPSP